MKGFESFALSDAGKKALLSSAALTALFETIESFVLLEKISDEADGKTAFDSKAFNNYDYMQGFLRALSDEGRELYLHKYLPMDNLYPLVYTTFFTLLLTRVNGKADRKLAVPVALLCFDYAENLCSAKMLRDRSVSPALARFASTMTNAKMLCIGGTVFLIAHTWWSGRN